MYTYTHATLYGDGEKRLGDEHYAVLLVLDDIKPRRLSRDTKMKVYQHVLDLLRRLGSLEEYRIGEKLLAKNRAKDFRTHAFTRLVYNGYFALTEEGLMVGGRRLEEILGELGLKEEEKREVEKTIGLAVIVRSFIDRMIGTGISLGAILEEKGLFKKPVVEEILSWGFDIGAKHLARIWDKLGDDYKVLAIRSLSYYSIKEILGDEELLDKLASYNTLEFINTALRYGVIGMTVIEKLAPQLIGNIEYKKLPEKLVYSSEFGALSPAIPYVKIIDETMDTLIIPVEIHSLNPRDKVNVYYVLSEEWRIGVTVVAGTIEEAYKVAGKTHLDVASRLHHIKEQLEEQKKKSVIIKWETVKPWIGNPTDYKAITVYVTNKKLARQLGGRAYYRKDKRRYLVSATVELVDKLSILLREKKMF